MIKHPNLEMFMVCNIKKCGWYHSSEKFDITEIFALYTPLRLIAILISLDIKHWHRCDKLGVTDNLIIFAVAINSIIKKSSQEW